MRLVIAEKPSVAAALAAALGVKNKKDGYMEGGGYLISWCVGHLVELAEAAAYGEQYKKWSYDSLPILPQPWQYTVFKDRQKQFKILKDLMRRSDVSEVVNACDAGREGELIFRLVYHAAGCDKPFSRLWISSMEKNAIKKGFAELKPGEAYDALYASALCRAKADWIIGINATRLFSVLHGKTLNVGRVQTPTLKMLADRDAAITSFKKEPYHIVRLDVGGAEAAVLTHAADIAGGAALGVVDFAVKQADHRGHALGGHEQAGWRDGKPDEPRGVERIDDRALGRERAVAIAGTKAPVAGEPMNGGVRLDLLVHLLNGGFYIGRACGVEHGAFQGLLSSGGSQTAFGRHPEGTCHERRQAGVLKVAIDITTPQLNIGANQADAGLALLVNARGIDGKHASHAAGLDIQL